MIYILILEILQEVQQYIRIRFRKFYIVHILIDDIEFYISNLNHLIDSL